MARLLGRPARVEVLSARPDQRVEFQPAPGCVALQNRQPWSAPRVQARGDARPAQGNAVTDGRQAAPPPPLGVRRQARTLGPRPEYKLEGTPVMIRGTLYTTGGARRSVVSLDGR